MAEPVKAGPTARATAAPPPPGEARPGAVPAAAPESAIASRAEARPALSASAPASATSAKPWPLSASARRKLPEQHLRVVRALRSSHATPLARRDAVLAELQASGESQEPWTQQARAALDTWRTTIQRDVLPVRAEPPRCYAAGCVARVTFPDPASYEEARYRVPGLKLGDVGRHLQLPAEHLPSGEVVVSWAVLSPARP